ncbi:mitochondrial pyruvate carriers like protein [Babesia gibsoni]|uniref:Mitochondrial pyruvate carrier n=1 Tax=Babesia gibsoni TaxID=33632 RepID=A0AAD8UR99_BABGI|nr:mitochondrial pyruvate carriers like protein [Babesia gibsoni]
MSAVLQKIFYPGIVPALQAKVLSLPLPEKAKAVLGHPAGPFTIHFYAPTFKWGISIANLADINRPTDKMSLPQQLAVTCTGMIWSRYSMVIIPKNYNLFAVNAAMALTGTYQLYRICCDRLSQGKPLF